MNTAIVSNFNRSIGKIGYSIKARSPEILAVAGVIGIATSFVLGCRATTKVNSILNEAKTDVDAVHEGLENKKYQNIYSVEDSKRDLAIIYAQTAMKLVKIYAPSVILCAASVGCMLTSNRILRKRNVALAAAYASLDKSFKEYRSRVVDRFGEATDRELKYNIKARKITETEVDPETGEEKKVKKTVDVVNDKDISGYARFFDETCKNWTKNPEMNLMFLRGAQNHFNDLLRARGHVMLFEVYDFIGFKRDEKCLVTGWIYDPNNNTHGDNYIDFGIYNVYREQNRDFVNGYEPSILLDFNVDGYIANQVSRYQFD